MTFPWFTVHPLPIPVDPAHPLPASRELLLLWQPIAGKSNDVIVWSNFKSKIGGIVVEKERFSDKIPTYGTGNPITGIKI